MHKELTLDDVIDVAYRNAVKFMQYDQPIKDYEVIKHEFDSGKLEGAIRATFQTNKGKYLIKDFYSRGAHLFYYLSKAHALSNGNKRLAVTALMVFLKKNKKWLTMPDKEIFELSVLIASSDPQSKDIVIRTVRNEIKRFIVPDSKMPPELFIDNAQTVKQQKKKKHEGPFPASGGRAQ